MNHVSYTDLLMLLVRVGEASVFACAGIVKLSDPTGGTRAIAAVGVPAPAATVMAPALCASELSVALLLTVGPVRWGALSAVLMLGVFQVALATRAWRGDFGKCNCFGRWSGRVSWASAARNAALSAGAISLWWWAAR